MKKQICSLILGALAASLVLYACSRQQEHATVMPANTIAKQGASSAATLAALDLMSGNPILPPFTADPDILYANGRYYIYTTANGPTVNEFHAYSSADLLNWVDEGVVFNLNNVSWSHADGWAPCVVARNGQYYFYFTASKKIGVAVGSSPTGPFTDIGAPLATGLGTDPIDPMAFVDTDGQAYLYWGNTTLNIQKLNSDMVSLTGTRSNTKPSNYFEAPYVIKRNGTYYLMYSVNDYRNNDYHVEYATSTSPMGPWTVKGRITAPNGNILGPGHNAVITRPGCSSEYYFVYHRRTSTNVNERQVAIDRMFFDAAGNIMPVNITTSGVIGVTGSAPCTSPNPVANGIYAIRSKVNTSSGQGLYLDIPACATGNADVRTWTRTNCNGQRWALTYQGNGFYKIISQQPNHKSLDLDACKLAVGTNIQVWDQLNNDCQLWRIEDAGGGWYRIIAKASGNVMDLANGDPTPGADIRSWSWNGSDAQLFRFEAAP
ncbi:MAG: family 43 glycosylhydrolase [Niabella sp.]|nr:family 43 glycosylhydrolase [Niabella sp.]